MSMQSEPVVTTVAEPLGTQLPFEQNLFCVLWKMGAMRKIESRELEGFDIVTELNVLISQEQSFNVTAFWGLLSLL